MSIDTRHYFKMRKILTGAKLLLMSIEYMDSHSRIQELTNNSEIENSRNKSHTKISEFTVYQARLAYTSG